MSYIKIDKIYLQYKELHEDTVISFPFYEITFDILL